jgi:hypothetical protein
VAADQAWPKGQKIPLAACGLKHFFSVDTHSVKDQSKLVNEGNVDIALRVFNDFGSFCHFDAAGFVSTGSDDLEIDLVNQIGHFGSGAGSYFLDVGQAVSFVAWIDTLGTVAAKKILIELQATKLF